jgi:hypothetical protein
MWILSYRLHSKYVQEAKYPLINFVCHIFRVVLCAYFVASMVLCKAILHDFFCSAKKKNLHIFLLYMFCYPTAEFELSTSQ